MKKKKKLSILGNEFTKILHKIVFTRSFILPFECVKVEKITSKSLRKVGP